MAVGCVVDVGTAVCVDVGVNVGVNVGVIVKISVTSRAELFVIEVGDDETASAAVGVDKIVDAL